MQVEKCDSTFGFQVTPYSCALQCAVFTSESAISCVHMTN